MTIYYVGADVHQTTTTLVTLNGEGKKVKEVVLHTEPDLLLGEINSLDGRVRFAMEESNLARWLFELLEPAVDEVIVCDPKRNKFGDERRKSDAVDALGLAELNYMGKLKPIYHGSAVHTELREIVKSYCRCNKQRTNAMNAIRGVLAHFGSWGQSAALFGPEREIWLKAVPDRGALLRLHNLFAEFDLMSELKQRTKKEMVRTAKQRKQAWRSVSSIPGIGDVRASLILGIIGTPLRFRTKRQLWKYSGLAVVEHSTSDYDKNLRKKRRQFVRGLNKDRNGVMKSAFKGAAESALRFPETYPEIHAYFLRREEAHSTEIAGVDVARKIASCTWTTWKRSEVYDPDKAHW
jgi:transposase